MYSMNNNVQELLLNKINLAYDTIKLDPDSRNNILAKYELLASYMLKVSDSSVLVNNLDSYSILLNRVLFRSIFLDSNNTYTRYSNLSKVLTSIDRSLGQERSSKSFKELQKQMQLTLEKHGGSINNDVNNGIVIEALKTFGLQQIEETNDIDDETFADEIDTLDIGDLFEDENIEGANVAGGNIKVAAAKALIDNGLAQDDNYDNYNDKCKALYDTIIQGLYEYVTYNPNDSEDELIDKATDIISDELIGEYGIEEDDGIDIGDIDDSDDGLDANETYNNMESDIDDSEENSETEDDKEAKKLLSELYESQIEHTVKDLVSVLGAIYQSGFSAMPHAGILLEKGDPNSSPLVKLGESHNMVSKIDKGTVYDNKIIKVITSKIPQLKNNIVLNNEHKDVVPDVDRLINDNGVCYQLHLQFQSANIKFCTGKTSIRKWITETQLSKSGCADFEEWRQKCNNGKYELRNYKKHVKPWYEWCLRNIIIDSMFDYGVRNLADEEKANAVIEAVNKNIRNIIAVSERDIGKKTELKISSNTNIDVEGLKEALSSTLNIGNSSSIEIKQTSVEDYEKYNVLTIAVIYDTDAENKSNLFAGDILNRLIDSGIAPSWDNALMGKKEDGTYFFWKDFMNPDKATPEKRCYTIYAGSRSGKGVMTSTLIANALCDNKQIFYTDGKPEGGACLGDIAWEQGKEAYVFDGKPLGSAPYTGHMEDYTSGVRKYEDVTEYLPRLPKCLFENSTYFKESDLREFLGIMRYLKSLALCAAVIDERAKGNLSSDNWQIWVFDEMTAMSRQEKNIREKFAKYLNNHGIKTGLDLDITKLNNVKGFSSKITPGGNEYDAGIEYIYKWQTWNDNIIKNVSNAAVISLGKALLNLIFIFQEPSWLAVPSKTNTDGMGGITTLAKIVKGLKSTKIAGNKAIPRQAGEAAGEYGDATMNQPWIDKINSGTGWWAMSNSSNIKSSSVTLFKPFTVWTTPIDVKNGNRMISFEELQSIDESAVNYKEEYYLKGYVNKLLGAYGVNPADVLQSAYTYADDAVRTLNFAGNLKEFIYDCSNFALSKDETSYERVMNDSDIAKTNNTSNLGIENQTEFADNSDSFSNSSDKEQLNSFGNNVNDAVNEIKKAQDLIKNIQKLMTCTKLQRMNMSNIALDMYYTKFISRLAIGNKFAYNDRQNKSTNALYGAAIVYSTVAYLDSKGVIDANTVKSGVSNSSMGRVAIGLIDCYSNGTLQYDQIPDVDLLRQLNSAGQSQQQQAQQSSENQAPFNSTSEAYEDEFNFDNMEDNILSNFKNETGIDPFQSEIDKFEQSGSYEDHVRDDKAYGEYIDNDFPINKPMHTRGENNEILINNPRPTQNVLRLNESKFISSKTFGPSGIFGKARARLYENRTGVAYELKQRWEFLLKMIEEYFKNPRLVNSFTFSGNTVVANGIPVNAEPFLDEQYGIMMENIVNFKTLFKKFPFIQKISLDAPTLVEMQMEYGKGMQGIKMMFTMHSSLRTIEIVPFGESVKFKIGRGDLNNQDKIDKLNELFEIDDLRAEMETFCAMKNPRLSEKDPGYIDTFYKKSKSNTSALFKKGWEQMMSDKSPNVKQLLKWGTVGAIVGVATFVPAVTAYSAKKGIGKLFGLLKN